MSETNDPARDELLREELRSQDTTPGTTPGTTTGSTPTRAQDDPLRRSRTSGVYAAVIGLGVVLILLIIFIAQNTRRTTVSFLAWDGQVPVAVALLVAAVAGLFLAGMAGTLRIMQLRRRVKRGTRAAH
jgi:uncharacterized integral membrane protein